MGYFTMFSLECTSEDNSHNEQEIVEKLQARSGYDLDLFSESVKWYSHDEDMLTISKEYPNILFKLHGQGEDCSCWITYYKNGLHYIDYLEFVIVPFDESKLK